MKSVGMCMLLAALFALASCGSNDTAPSAAKFYQPLAAQSLTITIPIVQ